MTEVHKHVYMWVEEPGDQSRVLEWVRLCECGYSPDRKSSDHAPELGQWAFSNNQFHEHPVSELTAAVLQAILDEIERVMRNATQDIYYGPGSSGGVDPFETDVFVMRPYCWCDGDKHEVCPPNFQWRDVVINWYKRLGRGMSANRDVSPDEVSTMLVECLAAVRALDVKYG